ncbi:MAG TPA: KEOPS complex subunit Cgi121 [candidate division Zixibacteria bacterium]|nr:KEOPS complex subunit Cgi121 [candidate division Zixibacteria bacterium]
MHQIEDYFVIVSQASLNQKFSEKMIKELVSKLNVHEKELHTGNVLLIIDAIAIAGITHLKACILNALHAFKQKTNITKAINTEILLYISGYRQISRAIKEVGMNVNSEDLITIQLIPKSKFNNKMIFDFENFINSLKILTKKFHKDVESLPLLNEDKIIRMLNITKEEIDLFTIGKSKSFRKIAIEKLAIEKSAMLNLIK